MRVLLTTPTYPPFNSGLGNAVRQQAENLQRRGVEVVVATGGEDSRQSQSIDGIAVERFALDGAEYLLNPIRGDAEDYVRFLTGERFDAVVFNAWQNWATDLGLRHAKRIHGRKLLYSHCISTNMFFPSEPVHSAARYLAWRPYWWSLRRKMRRLDGIIFLAGQGDDSRFADLEVAGRAGVPVHIVPNSVSPAARRQSSALPADRGQIIAVGSYNWLKGFDFVLRAYAASNARTRLPLKLFGQEHSSYSHELSRLAEELGLGATEVSFHEGVSGDLLRREYGQSRLFLSGSRTECQPLVLLDAMAAGTPFVARATGCISTMPGGVAVASVAEAAAAIDRLLDDAGNWTELSAAGRAAAAGIHDPDRNADLLLQVLKGESSGPNPTGA